MNMLWSVELVTCEVYNSFITIGSNSEYHRMIDNKKIQCPWILACWVERVSPLVWYTLNDWMQLTSGLGLTVKFFGNNILCLEWCRLCSLSLMPLCSQKLILRCMQVINFIYFTQTKGKFDFWPIIGKNCSYMDKNDHVR